MRTAIATFGLIGLLAVGANAALVDTVTLTAPRPPRDGDHIVIAVTVGPIGHQQIDVATASGQRLGTISPFGVAAGRAGGTYLLPVPAEAMRDGRLEVRLSINNGSTTRPPTTQEVTDVHMSITGP